MIRRAIYWWFPQWALALAVVSYVLFIEDRPLGSIGVTAPEPFYWRRAFVALLLGFLLFGLLGAVVRAVRLTPTDSRIQQMAALSWPARVAGSVTAGVTEEIVFRGFIVERLGDGLDSFGWAAAISGVLFVVVHVPFWGVGGAVQIIGPTIALSWLYVNTRNLPVCITMHVVNDLWAFLVAPRVLARRTAAAQPAS